MGRIKRFSASRHTVRGRAQREISRLNLKYQRLDAKDKALYNKVLRLHARQEGLQSKRSTLIKKKVAIQDKIMHLTYPEVK